MALVSSMVAAGQKILADHFNKLRQDLLSHTHGGGEGGTIDHADLGETGPMTGRTYDHAAIDAHIDSTNAHGIPDGTKVPGCGPNQVVIVAGVKTLGGAMSGTIYLSEDGTAPATCKLSSVLSIQLTGKGPSGGTFSHKDIVEVTSDYDAINGCFDYAVDHVGNPGDTKISAIYFTVVGKK